jgi:hypothetical protein
MCAEVVFYPPIEIGGFKMIDVFNCTGRENPKIAKNTEGPLPSNFDRKVSRCTDEITSSFFLKENYPIWKACFDVEIFKRGPSVFYLKNCLFI